MSVRAVAHLFNGLREQVVSVKDPSIFGKETENQPSKEVVHFFTSLCRIPFGVMLKQFNIQPVQPRCRLDIESIVANLLDRRDASQRQEETKVVGKLFVVADKCRALDDVLCFDRLAIGRQNVFAFSLGRFRALDQSLQ